MHNPGVEKGEACHSPVDCSNRNGTQRQAPSPRVGGRGRQRIPKEHFFIPVHKHLLNSWVGLAKVLCRGALVPGTRRAQRETPIACEDCQRGRNEGPWKADWEVSDMFYPRGGSICCRIKESINFL